ncbi:hypothetical protein EMIT0P4_60025 [Pseudomonas sp. IT-P4]
MSYAHADTCTDKHMQSPGQFAQWAFEKARTALWAGLFRQVSAGREAACEAVTKAVFYTRLGYGVTKCEIKDVDFQAVWIFEGVHIRCCGNRRSGLRPYGGSLVKTERRPASRGACPATATEAAYRPAWLLGAFEFSWLNP